MRRSLPEQLERAGAAYFVVVKAAAACTIGMIFLITILGVFYRYFLNSPLIWSEELTRMLLVWMCFLFSGAAFQRGEMVTVRLLTDSVPARVRALIMIPAYLATLGFLVLLVNYGLAYAQQNTLQTMPGIDHLLKSVSGDEEGVSIYWMYIALPIGCALLALHILLAIIRFAIELVSPGAEPSGGGEAT